MPLAKCHSVRVCGIRRETQTLTSIHIHQTHLVLPFSKGIQPLGDPMAASMRGLPQIHSFILFTSHSSYRMAEWVFADMVRIVIRVVALLLESMGTLAKLH